MRDRMDMPVTPQNLTAEHVSGIVKNAMSEAGSLYPVMRYMSVGELTTIVELKL